MSFILSCITKRNTLIWKKENSNTRRHRKKNEFQVRIELSRPSKFQFGALTIKLLEALWRAASKYTSHSQFPLLLRTAYKNRTINIGFIVSCSEVE